ncbi:MAG: hypothetical protein FWH49_03465 [Clostridiales bacterium]|nr:hypothetical protein [Clostridiales bacterium]
MGFLLKGVVICISFVVVFGVTYRLNQEYLEKSAETRMVVTAKADLLPGEPLTPEMLQLTEKPVFGLGEDYAVEPEALLDKGPWYVGDIGFGAGDILRPSRLVSASDKGGYWQWEFSRLDQARLIAVETSLVRSSGDWLWPGTLVDAMVYIPAKESYEDPQPSQIIGPDEDPLLRGLLVISKKNAGGMTLDGTAADDGYSRDVLPAVVTLLVGEDEVDRIKALIRYNEEGRIYFSPTGKQAGNTDWSH